MRYENRRAVIYSALVLIVLLLLLFTLLTDNNRKYADALNVASTSIARTNQALVAPMQTQTNRAVSTWLPMTQTRAALPLAAATSTP